MSAYDDLIPGTSQSRRRTAYDDLLPGGAPAATVQPAEDAREAGADTVTLPRVADLKLTAQEQRIVDYHRDSIKAGRVGHDEQGRPITVYAIGPKITEGKHKGKFASVPGWVGGRRLTEDEAREHWKDEIEAGNWPIYGSGEALNTRSRAIHQIMDAEAPAPRVAAVARESLPSMWGEMQPEEPLPEPVLTDAADNLYEPPGAGWGEVVRSIIPGAGAQIRNAVANLRRLSNEERIAGREMVLEPSSDPSSVQEVAYGPRLAKARERQRTRLAQEIAARPEIDADAAAAMQDMAAVTPKDMSTAQQAVFSAGSSSPTTLAGLAAGILTRNPGLAMLIAGGGGSAVQGGATYGEAREKGAPHKQAATAAGIDAIAEGVGEALPLKFALAPGAAFGKRLISTITAEAGQEAATQIMQDLNAYLTYNPEITLGEAIQNLKVAALSGAIGGTAYAGIGGAANIGRRDAAPMHSEDGGAPLAPEDVSTPPEPAVPAPAAQPANPYADLIPAEAAAPVVSAEEQNRPRVIDDSAATEARQAAEEARHTAFVDALNARQTAKIEAAKAAKTLTVTHPEIRSALEDMAKHEAGWAEVGGRMIRQKTGESAGQETISRTQWIPKSDWWKGRPGGLNEAQTQEAVRKAVAGEPLKKREQQAIDYMTEVARERVTERMAIGDKEWSSIGEDLKTEKLDHTHQNAVDADLVALATQADEAAVERAAVKYENDDAAFMAEMRRIAYGEEIQGAEAARGGQEDRGAAPATRPELQLEQQTEAGLAEQERARAAAEAQRAAEEQAAEARRKADLELDDFTLTGSERAADVNPGQGGLSLGMPAHVVPAGTVPIAGAASGATPPARAKATVTKQLARPDAIRAAMRELFGAPISEKGLSKKYLGIYRIKPQTVRLQNRNDLRTASHEVGHHISNLNRPFRKIMRRHQQELVSIAPRAYIAQAISKHGSLQAALANADVRRLLIEEGFAEFIAEYLTAPATLQGKVPSFYADFETWLQQNPRYAAALQQVQDMVGAHEALSSEDKILAKVGAFRQPLGQRVASVASMDTWDTFAQATLDKWHPLKTMVADLAPGMEASKNPYMAARLLAGDAAIIEDWITDFTTPFDYTKRLDSKNYGKPLKAILEPVLKGGEVEINKFKAYLIARRAAELKKAGKENLFTTEEIAAGLALDTPLFRQVAKEVYAYNDRLLDYAVEGGLLSAEVAAKFRQYANYIPFFREPEGDAKGGGRGDPFKRLMGGTANLRDPFANLIQNTANIVHATNRNAMVHKAVELAKAVPGGGRWIETVRLPQEAHSIATQRIIDELSKQGVQIDTSMAENMAAMQTFFMPSGRGDDRTRTIVYKQGGELKAAQVNDPLLWKALGNIPPLQMGLIGKMLAFPAQTLRAGVVLDPTFMVRNGVRDTLSATVQSKGKFIPVLSTAQGIKMMAQQKDAYRLWRAFGGAFADQFRDSEEATRIIERMARRGGFSANSIVSPMRWLDALKRVGAFTESGSRVGEFEATYKPGDIDSALQAALNAREVSTDFGMRGGSEAIQVLTRITPFMNPAMQGLYKTARVLSAGDGKAAAAKAAIVGTNMALLSMALALINSDEDWYREIEEWEKTTYWHFKVGDQVYRIPKPFEYGTLFASMPEAIALYQQGKEGWEDFKKRMLQALGFVFGFRVIPQVVSIVGEPWANKSLFTGRQLVPDRQRNLEPGLQAHPYSSKVAQAAGEKANVSPAVIDNVVRNVFGTMGVHASTVADLMLEQTGVFPPARERGWQTWPALKAFVRDPENPNSKQMRDFYEALEEYRKVVATVKEYRNRGEDVKAERYAEGKADEITMAKNAERAARRLAKLRKSIRTIEWSREMSQSEKRAEVNAINDELQAIVEEQTRLYQAAKKSYSRPANAGGQ